MFLKQKQRSKPDCIQVVVCKCDVSTLQETCFPSGLVDYALLLCRKFAAKLPHQVNIKKNHTCCKCACYLGCYLIPLSYLQSNGVTIGWKDWQDARESDLICYSFVATSTVLLFRIGK
ncbi:hypothetical protein AVEN_82440-1 [Araneus ventricosus]|uniref:Uncharacterized protein n=1 Tax=Araneus ventricosus TaxID=182803 RepID=A0A4Y2TKM0_ARAVE|nr:hypothetical protein AVEN_82440-1 [Araneus ventricosus]